MVTMKQPAPTTARRVAAAMDAKSPPWPMGAVFPLVLIATFIACLPQPELADAETLRLDPNHAGAQQALARLRHGGASAL